MSVNCEQPLNKLTVQVWLLYDYTNLKYVTLYASGTELQTNRRTNKWAVQLLNVPGGPFRLGA